MCTLFWWFYTTFYIQCSQFEQYALDKIGSQNNEKSLSCTLIIFFCVYVKYLASDGKGREGYLIFTLAYVFRFVEGYLYFLISCCLALCDFYSDFQSASIPFVEYDNSCKSHWNFSDKLCVFNFSVSWCFTSSYAVCSFWF